MPLCELVVWETRRCGEDCCKSSEKRPRVGVMSTSRAKTTAPMTVVPYAVNTACTLRGRRDAQPPATRTSPPPLSPREFFIRCRILCFEKETQLKKHAHENEKKIWRFCSCFNRLFFGLLFFNNRRRLLSPGWIVNRTHYDRRRWRWDRLGCFLRRPGQE